MPKFSYTAKEGPGKVLNGVVEAQNLNSAINKVSQLGLTPIDVSEAGEQPSEVVQKKTKNKLSFFKTISLVDKAVFTRQVSDLIEAAVPILKTLQTVSNQTSNPHFKEVILQMYHYVKDGGSFSGALAQHKNVFSILYVEMVKTGELSGELGIVLERLAGYLEKEKETRDKIKASLAYPALILVVGVLTIFVLLSFVIPRISVMFEDLDQALPLPTILLTSVSSFFAQYWWLMVGIIVILGVYVKRWLKTPQGQMWFNKTILTVPLFGEFVITAEIGRLTRTLGTLIESGVVITTALNSVWTTVDNLILREEIMKVASEVTKGSSLKAAFKNCIYFPEVAINMISIGEETGRLDRGLYKIADTYERQTDQSIKTIVSLLGPLVLVVIVSIVGFVVIAMMLPIFQMNLLIQ